MRGIQAALEPAPVKDYALANGAGPVKLSALFGDKSELVVVHNMGASCAYCTLWADGFNGLYPHLADRAAFCVVTPDSPETQAKFAATRGWRFPMASHAGSEFAADMGYRGANGGWMPGLSVFQRRDAEVVRVSDTGMGPYDDFCAAWHMFDMLPGGAGDWRPRFSYGAR